MPINLPFTHFHSSLKEREKVGKILTGITEDKRNALQKGECSLEDEDRITYLLSLGTDNGETLTEEDILDNDVSLMIAGHDTMAIVLTFVVRQLANDAVTYATVLYGNDTCSYDSYECA